MTTEIKLIAIGVLVIALALGGYFAYHAAYASGQTAGKAEVQTLWDADKAAIQKVADQAIATATKQRDDAIQANQVLHDQYEAKRASDAADTAAFAKRLRDAEARLTAANSRPVPTSGSGQTNIPSGGTNSADQLGQLVALTAAFRAECKANDDALDSVYASVNRQPHTFN